LDKIVINRHVYYIKQKEQSKNRKQKETVIRIAISEGFMGKPCSNLDILSSFSKFFVMIQAKKGTIPLYLHSSSLFESLNCEESDENIIIVPVNCLKQDLTITGSSDLANLLETLRYWCSDFFPNELINYCLSKNDMECCKVLDLFKNDLAHISVLLTVLRSNSRLKMNVAAKNSSIQLMECLRIHGCNWDESTCALAADKGNIQMLTFLHEHADYPCPWNEQTTWAAAKNNHFECLQYAHTHGCPWSEMTTHLAAKGGHQECFMYAMDQGCEWEENIVHTAILGKNVRCVQYAVEKGAIVDEAPCRMAVVGNSLECLAYLHSIGSWWSPTCCSLAAQHGYLDILAYLHENSCPWDENTCIEACRAGHLAALVYAHEHGCPWGEATSYAAISGCSAECLGYALDHGCPLSADTAAATERAAGSGALGCLALLHGRGYPWNKTVTASAAFGAHTPCLQYALENGCPVDEDAINFCVTSSNVDKNASVSCLRLLHEAGVPWSAMLTRLAMSTHNVPCFRYAVEHGCPATAEQLGWSNSMYQST
jgi:hypothetical protein